MFRLAARPGSAYSAAVSMTRMSLINENPHCEIKAATTARPHPSSIGGDFP